MTYEEEPRSYTPYIDTEELTEKQHPIVRKMLPYLTIFRKCFDSYVNKGLSLNPRSADFLSKKLINLDSLCQQ